MAGGVTDERVREDDGQRGVEQGGVPRAERLVWALGRRDAFSLPCVDRDPTQRARL
jgi:hypothetical protein